MRTIESTAVIHASPARVWSVLADGRRYADWNPFITVTSGELAVGSRPTLRIRPPGKKGMSFRPLVTDASAAAGLRWKGKLFVPGLCDAVHEVHLDEAPDGATRITQRESFRGMLVPLLTGMLEPTRQGFEAMHTALAERVGAGLTLDG